MPNTLLDFVMSLVRDPDAAARYAADPDQAIADAHLTDVTTADVNHLIPVVAESLSSAVPVQESADNVWTSGAATAAFDAFGDFGDLGGLADHVPTVVTDEAHTVISGLADNGYEVPSTVDDYHPVDDVPSFAAEAPAIDDVPIIDTGADHDWTHTVASDHPAPLDDAGFDIFD